PGRFTITPQRHYPLQQPGFSSLGVLPLFRWDRFRKKVILTPRNSPGVRSPVTVRIARPDHHTSPSIGHSVDHLSCAGLSKSPVDPCSRESVLKVLRETRKRPVEDEDRSFTTEQKIKGRRNDSGGSAHSAFKPFLPNGTPSQLVPQPGSLKCGMISPMEEPTIKRSRTSSISSGAGIHAPRGTPGTTRNAIHSSFSSTLGLSQRKRSAPSSSVSSPGSSRSQTAGGALKRPRREEGQSLSSASSVKSDQAISEKAPVPFPKVPVTSSADSTSSGGAKKRKIPLVPRYRDDVIYMPSPPQLGYRITAKDLDDEKMAAIKRIQKMLETPIIDLDPSPATSVGMVPAASTPLLEALKMKSASPFSSASTVSMAAGTSGPFGLIGQSTTPASFSNPVSAVASTSSVSSATSSNPLLASGFKPIFAVPPTATPPTTSAPDVKPSVQTFKPIFGGSAAGAGFRSSPVTAANPASTLSSNITSSLFGSISSTTVAPSIFSSMTNPLAGATSTNAVGTTPTANQPALKSLFGNWTTPTSASTGSVPALVPNTGSAFQFGAAATSSSSSSSSSTSTSTTAPVPTAATTSSSNSTFIYYTTFGATQPDPQAAKQKVFAFGQVAPSQNTTGASFGGFSAASTAIAAAATAAPPAFSFGKPSFQAPTTQAVFGSTTQATFGSTASQPPKPFAFGGAGTSSTPASNAAPAQFTFGAAAATTTTSFVTP
ncbi:unnamed protein product, partial [Tetraodon nigroviridis]